MPMSGPNRPRMLGRPCRCLLSDHLPLIAGLLCVVFCLLIANPALGQDETDEAAQEAPEPYPKSSRYAPTPIPDRIILTWCDDPGTTQSVTWRTDSSVTTAQGQILIAPDGPINGDDAVTVTATTEAFESNRSLAHYHSLTFTDLQPGVRYAYRVGDSVNWSEWSQFTTASDDDEPFSFIYFGDAQNDIVSRWSRLIREAYSTAPRASFLLHAGDLIDNARSDDQWGEWFEAGGWIYRTMPSMATPGNHEYYSLVEDNKSSRALSPHWRTMFTFPENGPSEMPETCYYIDYKNTRFISINSNLSYDMQASWLDSVLTDCEQTWTIVTMHHPVYSSTPDRDNPDLREALQPVIDKHRVDLVLQGHDHTYARSGLMTYQENTTTGQTARSGKGTLYVVSVSGPKMYELGQREFMDRAAQDTQLFQVVTVDGDRLLYEARTANGTLYDAFELIKQDGASNRLINRIPTPSESDSEITQSNGDNG